MAAVREPCLEIRPMVLDDVPAIMVIEQSSYSHPWSAGIFRDCLRIGYRCLVLTDGDQLCGYAIYSVALDEAHLLNLCVSPSRRRGGLASLLLEHVSAEVLIAGADRLFLEVRPSNRAAIRLYRCNGFSQVGRRPGYYPAEVGREDALVLVRELDGGLR